jgi:uncharacterized protein YdaU (DUF1376 family)
MPLYPSDYLTGTAHLTIEQSGAYLHLLMYSWHLGRLPDDDQQLAMLCRVTPTYWKRHIAPKVRPFFTSENGLLLNPRLEKERAKAEKNIEQKKQASHARTLKKSGCETFKNNDVASSADPFANDRDDHFRCAPSPSPSDKKENDGDDSRTRARTREKLEVATPSPPDAFPNGTPSAILIETFDAARIEAWGQERARPRPHRLDKATADRWLDEGAQHGLSADEVIDVAASVIQAVHIKLAHTHYDPPGSLAFHNADVARAMKLRTTPMPEVPDVAPAPRAARRGEVRRTFGSDDRTRRAAVLDAAIAVYGPAVFDAAD